MFFKNNLHGVDNLLLESSLGRLTCISYIARIGLADHQ
jgi:hypothetical protein